MKRKRFKVKGTKWCEMEIELSEDEKPRLSICGSYGSIIQSRSAKKLAREYWESFFADNRSELAEFALKYGKRTPRSAASYVLEVDGDRHGLDVHKEVDGKCYLVECCGQIQEELIKFFPDCKPYLKWHLNDMNAGCEHQEALGWGHGKDIALSKDSLTPAQRETLEKKAQEEWRKRQNKYDEELRKKILDSPAQCSALCKSLGFLPTISEHNVVQNWARGTPGRDRLDQEVFSKASEHIARSVPCPAIESKVYKDSLCAPCPECGYEYGTQWLYRELPPEVIAWVKGKTCQEQNQST